MEPMTGTHLLMSRAALGGLVFAGYGLWQAIVRLPAGLGVGTYTFSSFWAIVLFRAAGFLLAVLTAGLVLTVIRPLPLTARAPAAAVLETLAWLPLILWLVLNEVVYSTTAEVLGYDAILMTWHNLRYYQDLMAALRAAIEAGRLKEFAGRFVQEQARGDIDPI